MDVFSDGSCGNKRNANLTSPRFSRKRIKELCSRSFLPISPVLPPVNPVSAIFRYSFGILQEWIHTATSKAFSRLGWLGKPKGNPARKAPNFEKHLLTDSPSESLGPGFAGNLGKVPRAVAKLNSTPQKVQPFQKSTVLRINPKLILVLGVQLKSLGLESEARNQANLDQTWGDATHGACRSGRERAWVVSFFQLWNALNEVAVDACFTHSARLGQGSEGSCLQHQVLG